MLLAFRDMLGVLLGCLSKQSNMTGLNCLSTNQDVDECYMLLVQVFSQYSNEKSSGRYRW